MISTTERRHGENLRIPCAIPVELTYDGTRAFEADAVDLSAGGLSLRANSLPEVGATLQCHFETLPGGTRISGRGEVVWAKLSGERSGEFGLRFTQIAPEAQALISEMIAERVAHGGSAPKQPPMATLEFEHVEAPITAKLTRAVGRDVVFEQPLELLALGKGVVAHADKNLGHGNILRVDLRMDGGTPTLALTVRFSETPQAGAGNGHAHVYGEFDWGEPESGTLPRTGDAEAELAAASLPEGEVDTVPDLAAPLGVFDESASASQRKPRATAAFGRDEDEDEDADERALPVALRTREASSSSGLHAGAAGTPKPTQTLPGLARLQTDRNALTPEDFEVHHEEPSVQEYEAIAVDDTEHTSSEGTYEAPLQLGAAEQRRADGGEGDGDSDDDDQDTWEQEVSETARKSPLVRFLRIFAVVTTALAPALLFMRRNFERAKHSVAPHFRRRAPRRTTLSSTLRGFGASAAAAASVTRPRRIVGGAVTAPIPKWNRGSGRLALLATLMLGCGILLVYAMSPSAPEDSDLHREVAAASVDDEFAAEPDLALEPLPPLEPPLAATSGLKGTAATTMVSKAPARAKPAPEKLAPAKSKAAVREKSSGGAMGATSFGNKNVPNAQRFLLRLHTPATVVSGNSDKSGFSVILLGARAKDPAAPIAAAHPAVARAQILNRDGYAELTVRFEEKRSPAFRVNAQKEGLEILIGP